MSHTELLEAQGSSASYLLVALLFFALPVALTYAGMHGGPHLLAIWRRGRAYRARLRAARHAAPRLVRSTGR